ncbi:MAG: SDR family NAD(P)-dependent oxidoreductase, partial [Pyrinomonadaceae bacterium]
TNFWGVVNGSLIAARNLKINGGAIINVGSTLSDRAIPLQGMYCASKHAVKGFTDALRMELEAEESPVSVTLIKPAAIDTPYKQHAKNYLDVEPVNPAPVYAPETVADAILYAAENPIRDVFVGAGGKIMAAAGTYAPRITDKWMETQMIDAQKTDRPAGVRPFEGLYTSSDSRLEERGGYKGHVAESSIYTRASLHPLITGSALALGVGGLIYALSKGLGSSSESSRAETNH